MSASSSPEEPIRLLQKIVNKDKEAFGLFYDRFAPMAFGLALRILRNRPDAEEVTQDVFYQIWLKASNFNHKRGNPEAWLITMIRSRSIDRLRSVQRKQKNTQSADETLESKMPSLKSDAGTSDARMDLQGPMSELPSSQREALELAYFQGMTQTEIASRLDLPLGTVKTRMRDGLKKLRGLMEPAPKGQNS